MMELLLNQDFPVKVYFVAENSSLDMLSDEMQAYVKDQAEYKGKYKESYLNLGPHGDNFLLIGLGKEEELTRYRLTTLAHKAAKIIDKSKVKEVSLMMPSLNNIDKELIAKAMAEGVIQYTYQYTQFKNDKKNINIDKISFEEDINQATLTEIENIMQGVFHTRNLVNSPANVLTPTQFANDVVELFADIDQVEVEVFDKSAIEELEMEALLSVARGSDQEPRFVVMKYLPNGPQAETFALVGKGVTYDSGGYAIKSAQGMASMKSDMGGAASVVGAMYAIAKNKLPHNVYGVFAATENLINGNAFKNGDIINSMKGATIEVGNTDAEGRIVLADAIYYTATVLKPSHILDLATLTGAAVYTFGEKITPIMSNRQEFVDSVLLASQESGEMMWQMPMTEDIHDRIKGDISDLSNMPKKGKGGGIQVAAAFLEYFAEDLPWLHMDIAGTSYLSSAEDFLPKYATGVPVKTLYQIIKNL